MSLDYYEILNIKRDSSPSEIAQAYRTLSLKWHPKITKEDHKTAYYNFCQISEAFEVLSSPIKRSFFDKFGEKLLKEGLFLDGEIRGGYQFGGNPEEIFNNFFEKENPFAKIYDNEGRECLGSMFSHAFGGQNFKGLPPPKDLIVEVECTLNELYNGCRKEVNYEKIILNNDGRTTRKEYISRVIPILPGYDNLTIIRLENEGNESFGINPSCLIFKIKQLKHNEFKRQKNDLIYIAHINLIQALCSENVHLTTLDGRKLHIPIDEIISPKTIKKVKGEGMPIYEEKNFTINNFKDDIKKGDLYIKFDIEFPESLEQKTKSEIIEILK